LGLGGGGGGGGGGPRADDDETVDQMSRVISNLGL
jgi:hypothetical protein